MELCLHVEIVAAALKRHEEYALRDLYLLRMAEHGQGHCRLTTFRKYLRNLGFRRTQIEESIKTLLTKNMATRRVSKRGHEVLVPLTLEEMLERYGLAETRWRVRIPLQDLKGQGLRHRLFACVEAGLGDSPKARSTLRAITGVSKPTQRRGEKRVGAKIGRNYVRFDLSTIDRNPCVAEGHEGHHALHIDGSVYLQTANSYSYPTIPRRKRVVKRHAWSHCSDTRAQQPTARRRYHTAIRKARKQKVWWASTVEGPVCLPVLVKEDAKALGRPDIGIYGVV